MVIFNLYANSDIPGYFFLFFILDSTFLSSFRGGFVGSGYYNT